MLFSTWVARQNQDFHTSEVMAKGYIRVSSLAGYELDMESNLWKIEDDIILSHQIGPLNVMYRYPVATLSSRSTSSILINERILNKKNNFKDIPR